MPSLRLLIDLIAATFFAVSSVSSVSSETPKFSPPADLGLLNALVPDKPAVSLVTSTCDALSVPLQIPTPDEKLNSPRPASESLAEQVMKFGHPGSANDLWHREAYITSYNRATRNANWVLERITKDSLKRGPKVVRTCRFSEDKSLPKKFRVREKDFSKSKYDKGHLCRAANAISSQSAMDETFLMTNISPQVGADFNRGYWVQFENFCSNLAWEFAEVFVFTGPLFLPQYNKQKNKWEVTYETIGVGHNTGLVAVPTHFYKVILAADENGIPNGIGAFTLPNAPIKKTEPLEKFSTSIDMIERYTGLEFFQNVERGNVAPLCSRTKCAVSATLSKL